MELRDIEYFAAIAERGNLKRAAHDLRLTPPALSKSLRRLEQALEAKLVDRTGKGVQLTPIGTAFAAQARRLRLTLEDITREAADLNRGRTGHLRIGAGPTDCELLPTACSRLVADAPNLAIDILISDNDELVPLMLGGKLDVCVNYIPASPYPGIEQVPLLDDQYVAYAAADHPLANKKKLELKDLVGEVWTSSTANYRPKQLLTLAFTERGLPAPRITIQTRSIRLRLQMIARSRILGFGPKRAIDMAVPGFHLKVLRVKELTFPRPVGAMYRKGAYLAPSARRLIELLKLSI
jgi:DNA-binding transcriptional LysR family regulator